MQPLPASQTYAGQDPVIADTTAESKGSQLPVCDFEPPFPSPVSDVCMESSVDKRSRESPDLHMDKNGTIWQFLRALFPSTWRTLSPDALFTSIWDTRKHPEFATFSCFPC